MSFKKLVLLSAISGLLIIACSNNNDQNTYVLTVNERSMCDSMRLDTNVILKIRSFNKEKFEPFHYSISKMFKDGQSFELEPVHRVGLVFNEENSKSYQLVFDLMNDLNKLGYSIFLLENNFNIDNMKDRIGVLKTTDKYSVLRQIGTDGVNYEIDNDSLIHIIKRFDKSLSLQLIGASGDWCEFTINKDPSNWQTLADEVYKVCPDVVDQGTGTVEALANEMKSTGRLYFWWD